MPTLPASFLRRYRSGFLLATFVICLALLATNVSIQTSPMSPPPRPASVPTEAVWAGGADGGAWISCTQKTPDSVYFACRIYHDPDGSIWAQGTFVLRRLHWDAQKEAPVYAPVPLPVTLDYTAFDGEGIFLTNEQVLIPHGTIDYPAPSGHGKKQVYREGVPRG